MKFTALVLVAALLHAGGAHAQFSAVPAPLALGAPTPSLAESTQVYKRDFATHVYKSYPARIFRGKLPLLLYSVMLTETQLDAGGNVVDVAIIRPPAVDAVAPFIVQLIKRASPYPAPVKMGEAKVMEIWLVDRSGAFQLDTLTEGQR